MNLNDIRRAAQRQLDLTQSAANTVVTFVLPGKWGTGKKRLAGRRGPSGDCVSEMAGSVLVAFDAAQVIAFCDALDSGEG